MKQVESIEINLKNTDINQESVEIDKIHREFVQSAIEDLDEHGCSEVDKIEHTSRDGYIPHAWNKGGYRSNIMCPIWSGGYNSFIQDEIDSSLNYVHELGVEEFGSKYDPANNEEHGNWECDYLDAGALDSFYVEARAMYHGQDDETGAHSTTFELIARVSDAPYFRYANWYMEFEVEYKSAKELRELLSSEFVLKKLLAHMSHGEKNGETVYIGGGE